jgi:Carbohydrate binding module (family 6)
MGKPTWLLLLAGGLCLPAVLVSQTAPYQGKPFHDGTYHGGPQGIPGKVFCAYYDLGGEGVAYHDSDAKNNGSGGLNPADGTYLNQFRMDEGVDTSYTKFHDQIDNNPYNMVQSPEGLMYVGWTVPGEWFNLTVNVARAGSYTADLFYTSNRGGEISFDLDGKKLTGPVKVLSTSNAAEPIAWRQWHHWNLMTDLVKVDLPAGVHVLTFHVVSEGNMNFAYLDFKPQP